MSARGGRVVEGCVGGGTGMIGYGWKGGIGTASRRLDRKSGGYTLGVLVQLNCGRPNELTVAGVPVGKELRPGHDPFSTQELGSIIIVAATDAPLMPHQLKRIARRLTMGLARTGSVSGNGSGDLFIAFSTANSVERETLRRRDREDAPKLADGSAVHCGGPGDRGSDSQRVGSGDARWSESTAIASRPSRTIASPT